LAVAAAMPIVGALLIVLALIISVATVVGRYHYVLDGIAGMLLAWCSGRLSVAL
jgi:membrane-associated phospholipid phosphatase